jgi:hypothetical protein
MLELTCDRCGHSEEQHEGRHTTVREMPDGRLQIRDKCEVPGCDCPKYLVGDELNDPDEPLGRLGGEVQQKYEPSQDDDPEGRSTWRVYPAEEQPM